MSSGRETVAGRGVFANGTSYYLSAPSYRVRPPHTPCQSLILIFLLMNGAHSSLINGGRKAKELEISFPLVIGQVQLRVS